ncbi:hypothetical protein CALVIDRAFT_553072 [Calocera viscosa TUFC12733]|uniref:Uncharacterized protein n=1 Tax=Calocera viscosa (strain TUFC12733) TaxID=1330018 RepID=A0A167Q9Q8_CALVF|nr:hypothetical protein CALVIDRAFT_553072 [Calocera viscosa TUFC12733]
MLRGVLLGLLLLAGAAAQTSTNATCSSSYDWMSNSEGQSPCLVAADLQGVCNNDKWFIPSLPSGTHYVGPTTPQLATLCICNTVVYNLVSACAACQGGEWVAWADWTTNCSVNVMTRGSFPGPVPGGTSIPAWAEVDTSLEGSWNAVEARSVAGSALPDTFPSSTGSSSTSATSSATATTTPAAGGSQTNIGAIVGGVVGGVALILLLIALFFFFRIRKNRRAAARTAPIPLPTSYSSLSSRDGPGGSSGTPPLPGTGQGYSGAYPSPGGEKSAFLSPNGNGGNSPFGTEFPRANGNGASTFSGSGTTAAPSSAGGFVLYDPNDRSTWPTNIPLPVLPQSPSGTLASAQWGSSTSYPSHISGSMPSPALTDATAAGSRAASVGAVLDEDRAYDPVPTPAPTYRSSASPAPGGDRVLLRGPARQVGKRRPAGR